MSIKFDKNSLKKGLKDLEESVSKQLPEKLEYNPADSESKQISDVQRQFKKKGQTLNRSEAKSWLNDLKKKAK